MTAALWERSLGFKTARYGAQLHGKVIIRALKVCQ
jgi:hypothetical protein